MPEVTQFQVTVDYIGPPVSAPPGGALSDRSRPDDHRRRHAALHRDHPQRQQRRGPVNVRRRHHLRRAGDVIDSDLRRHRAVHHPGRRERALRRAPVLRPCHTGRTIRPDHGRVPGGPRHRTTPRGQLLQRRRRLELPFGHRLERRPGHHDRLRSRPVLPDGQRPARPDGVLPVARPASVRPGTERVHRRQRQPPRTEHQPRRPRSHRAAVAGAPSTARPAWSNATRWRPSCRAPSICPARRRTPSPTTTATSTR